MNNIIFDKKTKPALILDFDGTIRRPKSGNKFIQNEKDIELIPGIEEKINHYKENGYLIMGITNQAGVAHGFKEPHDVGAETNQTLLLFEKNPFYIIEKCFCDEKGNVEPFNHKSLMRKPQIGMLVMMEQKSWDDDYIIDWNNSLMVGDREEDEHCAQNAQIPFKYIDNFLNE